jgi:hypothetical protein
MHNSKLDFHEIFSVKPVRKNNKVKSQGLKYLDRPFHSIKPVKHILYSLFDQIQPEELEVSPANRQTYIPLR